MGTIQLGKSGQFEFGITGSNRLTRDGGFAIRFKTRWFSLVRPVDGPKAGPVPGGHAASRRNWFLREAFLFFGSENPNQKMEPKRFPKSAEALITGSSPGGVRLSLNATEMRGWLSGEEMPKT